MTKKKRQVKVNMEESYVVQTIRNEPAVQEWPKPALPFSENGLLVGTRHFGPRCKPNPMKSARVKVVNMCEREVVARKMFQDVLFFNRQTC